MKTTTETPFEVQLAKNIRLRIREWIADGTTGASVDCLKQCVTTPATSLAGAPLGTNARYYYAEMFRRVCAENRDIAAFLIE